ncbi:MAG: glycerophosphodiester phosphodiesterase family protein [Rhodanobacteraceae bacterium]
MTRDKAMQVIAHRGGAALRVENTLAAFDNAMTLGAAGAELDVHLSRDGQVIVHHDGALHPGYCKGADGTWIDEDNRPRIADLSLAELQRYEIGVPRPGSDYARRHPRIVPVPGQCIPLLRDVIQLAKMRSPHFRLVIEIKTPMEHAARQAWRNLLDATLDILREEDFFARAILCSFDWGALVTAKKQCPELSTWFTTVPLSWFEPGQPPREDDPPDPDYLQTLRTLYGSGAASWYAGLNPRRLAGGYPEAVASAGGDAWFMYDRDCTAARVNALHARGLLAATWSINEPDRDRLTRLARMGMDAACLDEPDLALEATASS